MCFEISPCCSYLGYGVQMVGSMCYTNNMQVLAPAKLQPTGFDLHLGRRCRALEEAL